MPERLNAVTFLFASDGSLASDGLSAFLQTRSNFMMLSECGDGATAIAEANLHRPDIAVIDAHLPDMSAREIVKAVRAVNRNTRIIVLGAAADRAAADELLQLGADAYVVRSGPSRHLNEAIRYVRDGGKYLAPELTAELPVAEHATCTGQNGAACSSLHSAIAAQAVTVQRLERAMDRAERAVNLLTRRVEQLTGSPVEAPVVSPVLEADRSRRLTVVRTSMSAMAAAVMLAAMIFPFSSALRPTPAPRTETTSVKIAGATAGWEELNVEKARSLLTQGQYADSAALCRMVLGHNPANAEASQILAGAMSRVSPAPLNADR